MLDSKWLTPELTSLGGLRPQGSDPQLGEYDYEHFRPEHLLADLSRP